MANLNKVFLIGNLTRDPELRYTPGGAAVAELGMAVNRQYRTQSGENQEETTFVDVVVWGKQAEATNQYLAKGRAVFIEGRLQLDTWETQDGQKRSKMRVVAERVQFLGGRPTDAPQGQGQGQGQGRSQGQGQSWGQGQQGQQGQGRAAPSRPPRPAEPQVQEPPPDDSFNLDDIPF